MSRRLLIIAAEFPPVKGIGRLRPLKFCQHLNALGWRTMVLTPAEGDIEPVDHLTLDEIPPETKILRVPIPKPKARVIGWIKSLLGLGHGDSAGVSRAATKSSSLEAGHDRGSAISPGHLLGKLDAFARRNLLIPDDIVLWLGPATRAGIGAVRDFSPNVILATAPYFTNLLVGARISRATGVPWVADYRDLWTGDVLRAWVPRWRQHLELVMERRILASASAAVTVSEPKSDVVRGRVPNSASCPVVTFTNGYDPEEFDAVEPERRVDGVFRIVYAGRLFKNRRGYELIEAVGSLLADRPHIRSRVAVEYYGGVAPEIARRMKELIDQFGLHDVVRFFPDVSYQRSKALQLGADALLLIVDGGETSSGVIPGKLFEYIASRRPILCISSPGATSEIIAKGRLGVVVTPGDVAGLASQLGIMIDRADQTFAPDKEFLAQFERRKIVEQLAKLLVEVASRSGAGSRR